MRLLTPIDQSHTAAGVRPSIRGSAVTAFSPRSGRARAPLLAIAGALFSLGFGTLLFGVHESHFAPHRPMAASAVTATPESNASGPRNAEWVSCRAGAASHQPSHGMTAPRDAASLAMTPVTHAAMAHCPWRGYRANPDHPLSPGSAAWPRQVLDGATFKASRAYLLEMSARLRHTTLGADAATRATVAADIAYSQARVATPDAAPEQSPSPAGQVATPIADEHA